MMPLRSKLAPAPGVTSWNIGTKKVEFKERWFQNSSSLKLEGLELCYLVNSISLWTSTKFVHMMPLRSKLAPIPGVTSWNIGTKNTIFDILRVPRGSVVKCLTRNPGVLGLSLTGSSGFFRGSVLGQDTSEPSLVLVKPRKAWIMWIVAVIWLKYC